MSTEIEIVQHFETPWHNFMVHMLYRTPHFHKDIEISYILSGSITAILSDRALTLRAGDVWVVNPYQTHELTTHSPALLLILQVPAQFFDSYYPVLNDIHFSDPKVPKDFPGINRIRDLLIRITKEFHAKPEHYELYSAAMINELFMLLLDALPCHVMTAEDRLRNETRAQRITFLTRYIDRHYTEKLLLSDVAEKEGLSLSYLSHFFKESFGMSFQEYLARIRCERARTLLLTTNQTLLDISVACGFSDLKYLNKQFKMQYGCSPREYRNSFDTAPLQEQQKSMLTTERFLSDQTALLTLERYSL